MGKYRAIANSLAKAYDSAADCGLEDQAFSKSMQDIILADYLGHELDPSGQGADAWIPNTNRYFEYKCSTGDDYIFHFGANKGAELNDELVQRKFGSIEAVYFAQITWGEVIRVRRVEMTVLLPIIRNHFRNKLTGRQLKYGLTWKSAMNIDGIVIENKAMNGRYRDCIMHLQDAYKSAKLIPELGPQLFGKGAHNHFLVADLLDHSVMSHGRGGDAYDADGQYEYKISMSDNFNFHFGARKSDEENELLIRKKIGDLKGAYCITRKRGKITEMFYMESNFLIDFLIIHFRNTDGRQLIKNFKRAELYRLGLDVKIPSRDT